MDVRAPMALICAVAAVGWLLLVLAVVVGRLRARGRRAEEASVAVEGWQLVRAERSELPEDETRELLERGLRSGEPDLRVAAITALGRLGHRHEWAIDLLVEGLADGVDSPMRVASQLDRLAPRPGRRLVPLLDHPRDVVRFAAVRLLAPYPVLVTRHAATLTRDRSPNVRAAALETLRGAPSAEALSCALRLVDDPHPRVRAHANLTSSMLGGLGVAPLLLRGLADESNAVRAATRRALALQGPGVAAVVAPLLDGVDPALRAEAALVLQDAGALDHAAEDAGIDGKLESIRAAGGRRLREAAAERARSGVRLHGARAPLRSVAR